MANGVSDTNTTGWGAFSGTTVGKAAGDPATEQGSLMFINFTRTLANNPTIILGFSSLGYETLTLGMATRAASFSTVAPALSWSFSLDSGSTWTGFAPSSSPSNTAGSFQAYSFSLPATLDNRSNFLVRFTIDSTGAGVGTSFALDNLQLIAATAVPEPGATACLALGGIFLLQLRRRRTR